MKRQLTLTIDRELLDKLRALAKSEHRSMSQQIEKWVSEKIAEKDRKTEEAAI